MERIKHLENYLKMKDKEIDYLKAYIKELESNNTQKTIKKPKKVKKPKKTNKVKNMFRVIKRADKFLVCATHNSKSVVILTCIDENFAKIVKETEKNRYEQKGYFYRFLQNRYKNNTKNIFKNCSKIKDYNFLKKIYPEFKKEYLNTSLQHKSKDRIVSAYISPYKGVYRGQMIDGDKVGSFGVFETKKDCIEEQERIIKQYDETGEYERLKIDKTHPRHKLLPHEKNTTEWLKGFEWFYGDLYLNGKRTNINREIINDIQSLKANGHNVDNIYAEFGTRYPDLDATAVKIIYNNLHQPNFQDFYDGGKV